MCEKNVCSFTSPGTCAAQQLSFTTSGLILGPRRSVITNASYTVKLLMPGGEEQTFEALDDEYILDTAEERGLELPSSCRSGACSACCAKLLEGEVDQSDGSFLTDAQIKDGYVLTCVAYPLTNVVLKTHLGDEVK
ncbi:hypothetical protein KP509_17G074400 [Ceratopteris richardii]|nr:hypothetical protein KP509_17G074400 [Ceratopteris richardii]